MNKFTGIFIAIAIVLGVGAAITFWPGGSGPTSNPGDWVPGGSSYTDTVIVGQPGQNDNTTTPGASTAAKAQAVQQTYQAVLEEDGNPDNTKLGRTAVEGEWALQIWYGDIAGGQALLRYETASEKWVIVGEGGGAWSVEGLVYFGVPEDIATKLLSDLRNQ